GRLATGDRTGAPGDGQNGEERAVADGGRLLEGAGEIDAPRRGPAQHVDQEEREAARVVCGAEAPTRDQPHGAERERRTVSHVLYLGEPWHVRLPLTPCPPLRMAERGNAMRNRSPSPQRGEGVRG